MNRARALLLIAVGIVLLASVCHKPEVVPERQWERGDFKPIGGKPFSLAAGLGITHMYGADSLPPTSELPLDMGIRNTTDQSISTQFPAGLVLSPTNHDYQYMMLLQPFGFSVPARAEVMVLLPTYCCNEELDEPDDESYYQTDIQVWERELNELIDLLSGKTLSGDTAVPLAQEALFEITDGNGLTDSMRTLLQNLP